MVATRMIEILPGPSVAAVAGVRILVGDVVIELPAAMTPADIGRVARAASAPC